MSIREIQARSILRKHKKIDSWFISRYGMNLYRGCMHDCVYCDGRSEKYRVEGAFGRDISVKVNAPEILNRELDPERKRKPLKKSFIMIGGGVGDSYQPADRSYHLTREVLKVVEKYDFPVHILTKSTRIKNELDIIKRINRKSRAVVSFSFSSVDDRLCSIFEPNVPGPSERLETLAFFKRNGLTCGLFLMPVIPFISDGSKIMKQVLRKGIEAGIDFVIFGGLTLKPGNQKIYFMNTIDDHFPQHSSNFHFLYRDDSWGHSRGDYHARLNARFFRVAREFGIPVRIPQWVFNDILDDQDRLVVLLEHMDYLQKLRGESSSYGYAALSISKIERPFPGTKTDWQKLAGVGPFTAGIIEEILVTGTSDYYRKLMAL